MDSSWWIAAAVCLLFSSTFQSVEAQLGPESAPSFIVRPENLTEKIHTTVVFQCQATGVPTPTTKWVKYTDGSETEIRTSGRFIVGSVYRYLYILGVQWSDAGRYGCVVQNEHGRTVANADLTILTESAPTWHIKPHNLTLYLGQRYTLPCRTFGYPVPSHFWTKNGAAIVDFDVYSGITDLYFYSAKTSHSGLYTCTASNVYGTISQSVYVEVVSDPTIVIQPENASTVRGVSVTLSCGVVGSGNLMNVKWMKNDNDLAASALISFSKQTWQNVQIYSLKILKVKKRHLGNYHCVVTNAKGTVTSNVAKVSFTRSVIPLIVKVPTPMVITTEGSDVELMCIFIGTPTPQVTWYKDGQELSNKGFQVTVALNNKCEAILKLSSITPSVAGNYVCKGGSIAGNIEGNIRLTVEGGNAPYVTPANQLKEAPKDSNVTLQFYVTTMADPDITWYKDGLQLEDAGSTRRLSNGTYKAELLITSVQYSDSGFYTCAVQNQFGVSSGNVTLTVKGSPEAPTNVTVKRTSLDTVLVSPGSLDTMEEPPVHSLCSLRKVVQTDGSLLQQGSMLQVLS